MTPHNRRIFKIRFGHRLGALKYSSKRHTWVLGPWVEDKGEIARIDACECGCTRRVLQKGVGSEQVDYIEYNGERFPDQPSCTPIKHAGLKINRNL